MGYLTNKIIKTKKLQKLSTSLVVVIPNNWIEEMGWSRATLLNVIWHPDEKSIIIKDTGKVEENEEIGESESE